MKNVEFELVAIFLLILANGVFAMSEIALVAVRKSRLQAWAEKGNRKARAAVELAKNPNQFFSTVQIGITLVGILAGAFAGRTLARELASYLAAVPGVRVYNDAVAVGTVVVGITYFTVIFGELVPKRIAVSHAETISMLMAKPMLLLSRLSSPLVWLLTASTDLIFRLFGSRPAPEPPVTDEEIKALVQQGTAAGVFEASEQDMIEAVISLGDKSARALMTPRTQIVWLDVSDSLERIRTKITESGHSRFPVCSGSLDNVIGITQAKDLLGSCLHGQSIHLSASVQQPVFVPRTMTALQVLEHIKRSGTHLVLVVDEYGGVEGLLTHHDVLEAIAGEIPFDEKGTDPRRAVQRPDGSWLLDGMLAIDEFKEIFHLDSLPGENKDAYQTLGGFLFTQLGRVPTVADHFDWANLRFEIVDMDGKRIDKVLVSQNRNQPPESGEGSADGT
jgi:putative hemolysin